MIASGSSTAWIHRGTTTGGVARAVAPGSGARGSPGAGSSGGSSTPPAPTCSRCCMTESMRALPPPRPVHRAGRLWAGTSICAFAGRFCGLSSILFVGDVVGSAGRRVIRAMLSDLRDELDAQFVVVNGENAAGGIGITAKHADELFAAGADVITLGNHTYRHRDLWPYLEQRRDIVRPANFLPTQPGRGTAVAERDGVTLGVVNLAGNLYMSHAAPALLTADEALREVAHADHVLVDMHAEATSEKVALGWYLDGKVTAVVGP